MKLDKVQACVFDAYGTLFDVHSAVGRHRQRLGADADRVSAMWRTKQLEYTWLRSLMGAYVDFWQITGDALDYALEAAQLSDGELRDSLMQAYLELECYPEVPAVLSALKADDMCTAVLSNGSPNMLNAAVQSADLGSLLDFVWSVDKRRIYKPYPDVYRMAVETLDVVPEAICFLSSNAWDVAGAAHFGFRAIWVNRFAQPRERLPGRATGELGSLEPLPGLVQASISQRDP